MNRSFTSWCAWVNEAICRRASERVFAHKLAHTQEGRMIDHEVPDHTHRAASALRLGNRRGRLNSQSKGLLYEHMFSGLEGLHRCLRMIARVGRHDRRRNFGVQPPVHIDGPGDSKFIAERLGPSRIPVDHAMKGTQVSEGRANICTPAPRADQNCSRSS
jgi:hypothetical protein